MATNRELVQGIYESIGSRDLTPVVDRLSDDVRFRVPATLPWAEAEYVGRAAVEGYFTRFMDALDGAVLQADTYVAEGDKVVATGTIRAKARPSGRSYEARFAHVWTVVDGQITGFDGLVDTAAVRDAFA